MIVESLATPPDTYSLQFSVRDGAPVVTLSNEGREVTVAGATAARMRELLAIEIHGEPTKGALPMPEPAYVRRAEDFMIANLHRAMAAADVARAVGISTRALFSGFRAHRGVSPMAWLRTRRFALARRKLAEPSAETVAVVALECGFTHLGRFSVDYRARFGESPTETLRAARKTAGERPR